MMEEMTIDAPDKVQFSVNNLSPKSFRCHIAVIHDCEGSWSVIVLNLLGAGGCGDTEIEAIEDAKKSVSLMIESYRVDGIAIPWVDSLVDAVIPEGAKLKWILVDA